MHIGDRLRRVVFPGLGPAVILRVIIEQLMCCITCFKSVILEQVTHITVQVAAGAFDARVIIEQLMCCITCFKSVILEQVTHITVQVAVGAFDAHVIIKRPEHFHNVININHFFVLLSGLGLIYGHYVSIRCNCWRAMESAV